VRNGECDHGEQDGHGEITTINATSATSARPDRQTTSMNSGCRRSPSPPAPSERVFALTSALTFDLRTPAPRFELGATKPLRSRGFGEWAILGSNQ
jgi:hypothetical protein